MSEYKPGRELDGMVAEHVRRYRRETVGPDYDGEHGGTETLFSPNTTYEELMGYLPRRGPVPLVFFVPEWSTNLEKSFDIFNWLAKRGRVVLSNGDGDSYDCDFVPDGRGEFLFKRRLHMASATGQSWAHAICLCALKAVGVSLHKEEPAPAPAEPT